MALAPGSRIGRIRIDALLGSGGMGEVYRGWDEKLERAVALKVLHTDKRLNSVIYGRFLREARALSKLDHPNICRIYDVLEREEGDYLVLELIEGQTLRKRMDEAMPRSEALEIALRVAHVLAATHTRGIIHRDLKPDNVMLTPAGVVKVLDFGLARLVVDVSETSRVDEEGDFSADDVEKTAVLGGRGSSTQDDTHTSAGSLVGTLHYMSPEQARGLPLYEGTDVYSLGILLQEMLTGESAYGATSSPNDLLVRVRGAQVRAFDSGDRALNALLKRMLALYPTDRPNAEEIVQQLEQVRERPIRIRRSVRAVVLAVGLAAIIGGGLFAVWRMDATPQLFSANTRGRLALLPFRNATGDPSLQWIERGLVGLVAEGVSRAQGVDVISPGEVTDAMRNLKLKSDATFTQPERRALLAALGADVAIQPTVVAHEGKYTIRYSALRANDAEEPREATSTVLIDAARSMSVQIAQRIDPGVSAGAVRERYSLDTTANMLYAMGMQELQGRGGPRVAAHYFTVCLDRDPEFLMARLALAECQKTLAENASARQLLADAAARATRRNDRRMLARALLLRAAWAIDDGDYAGADRAANEALVIGRATHDEDAKATAFQELGLSAWRVGALDRATTLFHQSLKIMIARRDIPHQARLYNNLGIVADSALRRQEAKSYFEKSLAIAERIDDRMVQVTALGNLAGIYGSEGNFARAEAETRRQVALSRALGDTETEGVALINLGLWLWAQGKESEAITVTEQATVVAERVGSPRLEAVLHANLATAYTKHADFNAARRHAEIAVAKAAPLDDPEVDRDVQLSRAYLMIREGKLTEAVPLLERAERWQKNSRSTLMRARLAYARGQYTQALELISRAKTMDGPWLTQNEQMLQAFAESARTGQPSPAPFETAAKTDRRESGHSSVPR